jgi:uncharacterized secreted protein with C-terminal beta-propeller domain
MADSVLLVKKGWQLIGSSTPLSNMSTFKRANVEQVWHFDAKSQTWLAYSPDEAIQKKMKSKNISKLQSLKNWHGFWVKSKEDWTLTFKDKIFSSEPSLKSKSDIIELKKGWNLISLPVDSVLSSDIFKDMTVWKYSNKAWKLSGKTEKEESFPRLGHIKNSDGIWVKSDADQNISVMDEASKLHNFETVDELKAYITEMASIYRRPTCGIEPFYLANQRGEDLENRVDDALISSVADTSNVKDASSTNLQEKGVDEADILKHNGKNIFYIGKSTDGNGKRDHINISSFEKLVSKEKVELNRVSLTGKYISSFYLVKDRLVVLSRKAIDYNNRIEDGIKKEYKEQEIIDIFDVSNINNVKKIAEYKVDGSLTNSRVIGNNLYLISSFYPKYEITYPKEYLTPSALCRDYLERTVYFDENSEYIKYADCFSIEREDNRYFRYNYDAPNVKITDLLPEINGKELVTPKRLYASAKQKQSTSITTISNFSIDDAKYLKSTSFIGESSIEYASSSSLYLVSNGYPLFYDFNNYKQRSTVYKFNFDDEISYKAIGSVDGTVLNQFALSEYKNILRIATTEGFSWGNNGTKNSLYTLKEKDGLLPIEGVLSGLGKEGESIKSVRFMGNKAYLVTFKTKDPLYTIDLSNPKSPKKMGELEVSGYSAYLHPIGEDKLLGIGQDTDADGRRKGVKIELFDISDFEHPSSLDTILLAKETTSELEYNHKALAYRASDNIFAFPYQQYINGVVSSFTQNNLGVYQVKEDGLKSYEPITSQSQDWGEHRGIIFDFNNKTYISFFSDDTVISKELTQKEK